MLEHVNDPTLFEPEVEDYIRFKGKDETEFKTNKAFLHIPRTGGKSIKKLLWHTDQANYLRKIHLKQSVSDSCKEWGRSIKTFQYPPGSLFIHHPMTSWKPEFLDQHQVFTLIRNPWARLASHYYFSLMFSVSLKYVEPGILHDLGLLGNKYGIHGKYSGGLFPKTTGELPDMFSSEVMPWSFDEWLDIRNNPYYNDPVMWGYRQLSPTVNFHTQKSYVLDYPVDCLRFEHIDHDIGKYLGLTNLYKNNTDMDTCPTGYEAGAENKGDHVKNRLDYKELYNDKQIQLVADLFSEDIDHWGFDFDTGATKNIWSE